MDKIGKSSTKHECLKNPLFDVARLFIGIGLARDICEPLDKLPSKQTSTEMSHSPTNPSNPSTIRNVQNQVQPSPPSSPNLSALFPHVSCRSSGNLVKKEIITVMPLLRLHLYKLIQVLPMIERMFPCQTSQYQTSSLLGNRCKFLRRRLLTGQR